MPLSIILLSVLGLAPFIACGLAALGTDPVSAARMLDALIAWAAAVLAFAGGVHWGLVLRGTDATPAPMQHGRIGLAVLPLIVAWVALVLPLVAPAWISLLLLIAGYIGSVVVEHRGGQSDILPLNYVWLRWGFTIVAVAMLTTVLTLHLLRHTIAY